LALITPTRNLVIPPIELSMQDMLAALVHKQQRCKYDDLQGIGGHKASDRQNPAANSRVNGQ
jgi:hypothetical protein